MTGFSGIQGQVVKRKGGQRYLVHWKARFFLADKVIHQAVINSIFKGGFSFIFSQALPIGKEINLEMGIKYRDEPKRIRIKAKIDYCLLRSNNDGAEIDIITTKIGREDNHTINNILQMMSESKEFNLRQ